jgi:hypothetical protein
MKDLRDKAYVRNLKGRLANGAWGVYFDPPSTPASGLRFSGRVVGRTADGTLYAGACVIELGDPVKEDIDKPKKFRWHATVHGGVTFYTKKGPIEIPYPGEQTVLDWRQWAARQELIEKRAAKKKPR